MSIHDAQKDNSPSSAETGFREQALLKEYELSRSNADHLEDVSGTQLLYWLRVQLLGLPC